MTDKRDFTLIRGENGQVKWNSIYEAWEVRIKDKWYLIEKNKFYKGKN